MATIHLHQTTASTPEQFIAGLTDFGPGRSKLFGNSADDYLEVHDQGPTHADVTEGSRGIWERLHYDSSDPSHVVLTTTDSNVWGATRVIPTPSSSRPTERPTSTSSSVREGKNLKGRMLEIAAGIIGKRMLEKQLGKTVKTIEARNVEARPHEGSS